MSDEFPDLGDWQKTRRSLHTWCKVLSAVRGALSAPHPRWWHISLSVTPRGLSTGPLPGAEGAAPTAELDLRRHELTVGVAERRASLRLDEPPSAAELARWLGRRLESEHGLDPEKIDDSWPDAPAAYDPAAAGRYHRAVASAAEVLERVRDEIPGERGPVQLWSHHFDLAFELFGRRRVESEGELQPAQIGFGFFPGDDDDGRAYFYGTPWPFTDELLAAPLPPPAAWQKEPWEGAHLPYSAAVADGAVVDAFLRTVHASGRSVLEPPGGAG